MPLHKCYGTLVIMLHFPSVHTTSAEAKGWWVKGDGNAWPERTGSLTALSTAPKQVVLFKSNQKKKSRRRKKRQWQWWRRCPCLYLPVSVSHFLCFSLSLSLLWTTAWCHSRWHRTLAAHPRGFPRWAQNIWRKTRARLEYIFIFMSHPLSIIKNRTRKECVCV